MKKALVTGILGQDGPYLADLLVKKNYEVYGMVRSIQPDTDFGNLDYLGVRDRVKIVEGDMVDENSLIKLIQEIKPDEVYNLASRSFVADSWNQTENYTFVNSLGPLYLLKAIKDSSPKTKFYQASTSEIFGDSNAHGIQTEETPFHPKSPYAITKLYSHMMANNFKESHGLFCCNGILFNHESPIRGKRFVTRKISDGVARIKHGLSDEIRLGNLDSKRDWGFAGDYVEAMWLMMQQEKPDNYIISTGEVHTIRDFLETAFNHAGISNWEKYIKIDEKFKRPAELRVLQGKSDKARDVLGWTPKVSFDKLVKMMVDEDIKRYNALKIR